MPHTSQYHELAQRFAFETKLMFVASVALVLVGLYRVYVLWMIYKRNRQ
ncbi:MAG: hypothetical protein KDC70_00100 [Saprospiraceae bacterium]|nr:hypothetical protein [Saprospiraceae bacterium]